MKLEIFLDIVESFKITVMTLGNLISSSIFLPVFIKSIFFKSFPKITHHILHSLWNFFIELSLSDNEKRTIFFKNLILVLNSNKFAFINIIENKEIIDFFELIDIFEEFIRLDFINIKENIQIYKELLLLIIKIESTIDQENKISELFLLIFEKKEIFTLINDDFEFIKSIFFHLLKEENIILFMNFLKIFMKFIDNDKDHETLTMERNKLFILIDSFFKKIDNTNENLIFFNEKIIIFFCLFFQTIIFKRNKEFPDYYEIYMNPMNIITYDLLFSEKVFIYIYILTI